MATILELAQDAAIDLSIATPSTLFGTSAPSAGLKLLRHITRTCRQLSARHDWSFLCKETTFTTVAQEVQTNAVPSDFLRMIEETQWNRTVRRPVTGPLTESEWQNYKASVVSGIYDQFVLRGTTWLMQPVPPAGHTIAFEYITKNIGLDNSSNAISAFSADDDTTVFDEELIILGAVWRYRQAEKLDYAEDFREFEIRRLDLLKMDGGRRKIAMGGSEASRVIKPKHYVVAAGAGAGSSGGPWNLITD